MDSLNHQLKSSVKYETLKKEFDALKAAVKLTDFTAKQLEFLIDMCADRQAEAQYYIDKHIETGTVPPAHYHETVDFAQAWATQLIAAKAKVIVQENIQSN